MLGMTLEDFSELKYLGTIVPSKGHNGRGGFIVQLKDGRGIESVEVVDNFLGSAGMHIDELRYTSGDERNEDSRNNISVKYHRQKQAG